MNYAVYGIFDNVAGHFLAPFLMRSEGEALRTFKDLVNEEGTPLNKNPEDYTLYKLGTWNEITGEYDGGKIRVTEATAVLKGE